MMFHSQKGDKYIEQVIKPFLPNARLGSYLTVGVDSDLNLELDLHSLLENSQFQRKLNGNNYFIHFTSITNLFHIIRSQSIWMKDLDSLKDEKEFIFANSHLTHEESSVLKSKLLSLSLCEFSDETVKDDSMWQEYADNHKGVCIKLLLHSKRGIPSTYQLGKIAYNNENAPINELLELKDRHDSFRNEHGYTISNIGEILFVISAMYKRKSYKNEQEIRLIKTINSNNIPFRNSMQEPSLQYTYNTERKDYGYFMELPLNKPNESLIAPHISIEEIILGKEIEDKEFYFLQEIIAEKYQSSFNQDVKISIIRD
jgi:hypothetical protein